MRNSPSRPLIGFHALLLAFGSLLVFAAIAPSQSPSEPVAVVAGEPISEDELDSAIASQLQQLHNQEYQLKSNALENLIQKKLLEAEARSKGLTTEELLEQEVDSKVGEPADAEVEAYYLGQRAQSRPFEDVKEQLRNSLKQARIQQARQAYMKRLRAEAEVVIYLRPPRVRVEYDPARLRGDPKAPVTIVEFSDFQCPYCRSVEPTLTALLAKYDGKVNLAYRDFPLRQVHPQAEMAAEAARCAGEHGKFWEYHDALFGNPVKLDKTSLIAQARELGLDEKAFETCLASGTTRAQVENDVQAGRKAGVSGTPAFFINGIFLPGSQSASVFETTIERELSAMQTESAAKTPGSTRHDASPP